MKLKKIAIEQLTPADYNPRKIADEALAGLAKSIEKYGYLEPIIYNTRTGNVVGGHQRLKVLKNKGVKEVEAVCVDLPEIEEKALNVTLNNPHIQGEFDLDALPQLLDEIGASIPDEFDDLRLGELDIDVYPDRIPEENTPIDNEQLSKTKNCCPSCGFKW